jgi:isocitrate/isopropylmalate dehydrogenase
MLARFSLGETGAADAIDAAVTSVLEHGPHTADLCGPGAVAATTASFTNAVIAALRAAPLETTAGR